MARRRLIFLAPLLVVGCEVFFGIKEVSSGSAGSGGNGGGTGSTGSTGSGGAVTVADAGAGGSTFCASMLADHFLCSDFEDASLRPLWSDVKDGAADVILVVDQGVLDVGSSPAIPPPACETARVIKEFDGDLTAIHVDFAFSGCDGVFQGTAGSEDFLDINCAVDMGGGNTYTFGLVKWGLHPTGYELDISAFDVTKGAAVAGPPVGTLRPPAGMFTPVHLDVTFGDAGSVQLYIGDAGAAGSTSVNTSCPTKLQKSLLLGIFGCKELTECTVRFDNVVVDVAP